MSRILALAAALLLACAPAALAQSVGAGGPPPPYAISTQVSGLGTGVATALGSAVSGSGGPCLTTSCAMTTPNLGTPSAINLANATNLPAAALPAPGASTKGGVTAASGTSTATVSFATNGSATFSYAAHTWNYACTNGVVEADMLLTVTPTSLSGASGNLQISLPNSYQLASPTSVAGAVSGFLVNSANGGAAAADGLSATQLGVWSYVAGAQLPAAGLTASQPVSLAITVTFRTSTGAC